MTLYLASTKIFRIFINMNDKEKLQVANKVYPKIREYYGLGKKEYPPLKFTKTY